MNIRTNLAIAEQLIRDTFRQARASGIAGILLAVTAICVVLCLSVRVSGDVALQGGDEPVLFLPQPLPGTVPPTTAADRGVHSVLEANPELARREGIETISGSLTLAFGAVSFPLTRERADAIGFLELLLAGGVAGTFGLLLALVWTAGFFPSFLEPHAAPTLLAKPVARWQLLLGKYLGVLTFVGFQVALFIVATWLALGVRTQVWNLSYLWCIPLLLLQFAIFYSISVLLAVVTRSTMACLFGSVLYWLLAWGINCGSVMARGLPGPEYVPSFALALADAAYWISPKPIDAQLILFNILRAEHHFERPVIFKLLESGCGFSPHLSILSSLGITGVLLALSAFEFDRADY
ncbi:MAG TPA: transcriptional regulator [Isosphaeraceae bacterium]|nr:transcriptional regulator [Isosphaeraceae bacterium]